MITPEIIERIKLDAVRIRQANDRTDSLATRPFRWEGVLLNPNGWRTLGHLADDLELLAEYLEKNLDDLK